MMCVGPRKAWAAKNQGTETEQQLDVSCWCSPAEL